MDINRKLKNCDYTLIFFVFALAIFGIVIIGSAKRININGPQGEFTNQIIWFISGIVLMAITMFIDYKMLGKLYIAIYILNIILLILVLLIGGDDGGVRRWLFGIQPSEFAKIFMIIYFAKFIEKNQDRINDVKVLILALAAALIPFILIKMEPSLSASLVIMAIFITEMFVGNISARYIRIALAVIIPLVIILYIDLASSSHPLLNMLVKLNIIEEYHIKRLLPLVNPDLSSADYYQTKNSIWAIGSGQLKGKGLYNGTINQLSYLPESHNDFIFSVVGEEFGFFGCLGVLAVMLVIIGRCIKAAYEATDFFGKLVASGVAGMLLFQTFVDVGVATGILPNTGMPFPFMSYGGSSMWVDMIAIGLVLSIGINKPKSMF